MHAWIFRNRHRLRLIYGHGRPLDPREEAPRDDAAHEDAPATQARSGRVLRLDEGIEMQPMPRRVG